MDHVQRPMLCRKSIFSDFVEAGRLVPHGRSLRLEHVVLGCLAAISWTASRRPNIHGVFLVSPPDPAGPNFPAAAPTFTSLAPAPLDVPGLIIGSEDDPYCATDSGIRLAAALQLDRVSAGFVGHINSASRLGRGDFGRALLTAFTAGSRHRIREGDGHPPAGARSVASPDGDW